MVLEARNDFASSTYTTAIILPIGLRVHARAPVPSKLNSVPSHYSGRVLGSSRGAYYIHGPGSEGRPVSHKS